VFQGVKILAILPRQRTFIASLLKVLVCVIICCTPCQQSSFLFHPHLKQTQYETHHPTHPGGAGILLLMKQGCAAGERPSKTEVRTLPDFDAVNLTGLREAKIINSSESKRS
jgi:hypothetical protein